MAKIIIPKRFLDKLNESDELEGVVKPILSSFGYILKEDNLHFFQEYTNHGIKHIEDVLLSSDNLITEATYSNILTDKDIGYYILAVILHDIGMHIDLEGFNCLINGDFDDVRVKEFDGNTWKDLWEDYFNEARKFSGNQLKSIFGDEDTLIRTPPFSKPGEINENDKKLIGEFIRRHHPRLAHEIALKGFPAKPEFLMFAPDLDEKTRNIIGLIARSHGISLRMCLDYIENIYGKASRRLPYGIHATYLMVLLRIADYIQIDSKRTSIFKLKTKTFSSPVSEMEHKIHLAVDSIDFRFNDDPERIFVHASPTDSKMFLKLQKLIKDIQYEFDISWAVLGELYGKGNEKDKAEIKFRRISSNIENEIFIKKQNYIADNISFKANDEIIKLLVAPLYGNNIIFGVRELLQNAIDACKEREAFEKRNGRPYTSSIKIEIYKNGEDSYFKISDNGMGMDIDIIKKYFLSAGASYRKSIEWQKKFVDEKGNSTVRRSGRFGVGILASFLIGKQISVETKSVSGHYSYSFNANLDYEQINIFKSESIIEGTIIKIKIDSDKIHEFEVNDSKRLNWYNWFSLSNPHVTYYLNGIEIIPFEKLNPDNNDKLPLGWHSIDSDGYDKILWTYSKEYAKVNFTCNGIVIPEVPSKFIDRGLIYNLPKINIFDNNAILPLTLDRNTCSGELSFSNDLVEDLYKDLIAYLLVFEKSHSVRGENIFIENNRLNHPGIASSSPVDSYNDHAESAYGISVYSFNRYSSYPSVFLNMILVSKKGFILNYNFFINKLKLVNAILIEYNNPLTEVFNLDIQDRFMILRESRLNSISDYTNAIEARNWNSLTDSYDSINSRIFLKSEKYNFLFTSTKKRVSQWLNSKCEFIFDKFNFTCIQLDKPIKSLITDDFLKKNAENIHFIREYEIKCNHEGNTQLNNLFEKYLGDDYVIPFSMEERKKKYPLAFKELDKYMKKYINS